MTVMHDIQDEGANSVLIILKQIEITIGEYNTRGIQLKKKILPRSQDQFSSYYDRDLFSRANSLIIRSSWVYDFRSSLKLSWKEAS